MKVLAGGQLAALAAIAGVGWLDHAAGHDYDGVSLLYLVPVVVISLLHLILFHL